MLGGWPVSGDYQQRTDDLGLRLLDTVDSEARSLIQGTYNL